MVANGSVVGGDYKGAIVSTPMGSTLVVQAGLRFRKLTPENVTEWDEVITDGKKNPVGDVSKAVAGAILPGRLGKAASAAVAATFDAMGSSHTVRVDWADGKRSLIKLPDGMFKHFELVLENQRALAAEALPGEAIPRAVENQTVTEQAFSLVSGIIKDRLPAPAKTPPADPASITTPDVTEVLSKLASLRDAGILTEVEFNAKKAELLGRL
ncbi:putative oligomerization/nucleic acid binding protein [Arthrobacter sp. SLBN-100]|uniref:SHOCT domain-containing protein n=1 Tax=Arthrobacter sp. SLBN-100 TaxID=2768450 RepID=UPI00117516D0|nr:SHOCT domain-containing protein [Arthrobacter sp. SLBN-100]TQJ69723.1 putative oligomerization/nucleic acid binding protein [Arthrobacter sp. SLBN-100]